MSAISFQAIGLRPAVLRAVQKRARTEGKTPPEYLRSLIERDLLASRTFDEILRPVRAGFKKSGITEEELDLIVDRARKDIHIRGKQKARR